MVGLSSRARQGRQQNGDTYTLEIAFPAVKYVNENYKYFHVGYGSNKRRPGRLKLANYKINIA